MTIGEQVWRRIARHRRGRCKARGGGTESQLAQRQRIQLPTGIQPVRGLKLAHRFGRGFVPLPARRAVHRAVLRQRGLYLGNAFRRRRRLPALSSALCGFRPAFSRFAPRFTRRFARRRAANRFRAACSRRTGLRRAALGCRSRFRSAGPGSAKFRSVGFRRAYRMSGSLVFWCCRACRCAGSRRVRGGETEHQRRSDEDCDLETLTLRHRARAGAIIRQKKRREEAPRIVGESPRLVYGFTFGLPPERHPAGRPSERCRYPGGA